MLKKRRCKYKVLTRSFLLLSAHLAICVSLNTIEVRSHFEEHMTFHSPSSLYLLANGHSSENSKDCFQSLSFFIIYRLQSRKPFCLSPNSSAHP